MDEHAKQVPAYWLEGSVTFGSGKFTLAGLLNYLQTMELTQVLQHLSCRVAFLWFPVHWS